MSTDDLLLHQEVLLLALKDDEGTPEFGVSYSYAVAGAILAELFLNERVTLVQPKKRELLELVSATPLGDPVLDNALEKIRTAKRRATPATWVPRFGNSQQLRHDVAAGLVNRGILKADEGKILWIFKRRIYPEIDPGPERRIIARLEEAIFTDTPDVEPRTAILISLANATGLLKPIFDRKRLKARKDRMEQLTSGEFAGAAAQAAVQAASAAAMAAITAATTVTVITS
jgi:Golgi phosphoprotein 3